MSFPLSFFPPPPSIAFLTVYPSLACVQTPLPRPLRINRRRGPFSDFSWGGGVCTQAGGWFITRLLQNYKTMCPTPHCSTAQRIFISPLGVQCAMKNCVLCLMSFTGFLIHMFHCQLHHESYLPVKRFRRFLTPVRKNRRSFLAWDQIDKTFSSAICKCGYCFPTPKQLLHL